MGNSIIGGSSVVITTVHFTSHHQRFTCRIAFQQGRVQVQERLIVPLVFVLPSHSFAPGTAEKEQIIHDRNAQVRLWAVYGDHAHFVPRAVAFEAHEKIILLQITLYTRIIRALRLVRLILCKRLGITTVPTKHIGVLEHIRSAQRPHIGHLLVRRFGFQRLLQALVCKGEPAIVIDRTLAAGCNVLVNGRHLRIIEHRGSLFSHSLLHFLAVRYRWQKQ